MSPRARVLAAVIGPLLLAAVASGLSEGAVWWGPLLLVLGAMIGPFMGLAFPFDLPFRLAYGAGLLMAASLVVVGWRRRAHLAGQATVVAGAYLWVLLGLLGVGTGT